MEIIRNIVAKVVFVLLPPLKIHVQVKIKDLNAVFKAVSRTVPIWKIITM